MPTVKQKIILEDILAHASLLNTQHDEYVAQFVTRANEELYVLLAEMMAVCEEIWDSGCEEYILKSMRKKLKEDWNIKTQKNTGTTSVVVRYITHGSRQVVHNYASVLNTAKLEGITADGLVQYIKDKGSIDAIRKKLKNAEEKKIVEVREKQVRKSLADLLQATKNLGKVSFNNGAKKLEAYCCDVQFSLLLSVSDGNGERIVASIYPSSTILQECLALYKVSCKAAALDDGTGNFEAFCKEFGLNMDVVHRWMRDNQIADRNEANEILRAIYSDGVERLAANDGLAVTLQA